MRFFGLRNTDMTRNAVQYVLRNPPDWGASYRAFYYWYYATQGTFHYGKSSWNQWRPPMMRLLLDHQKEDGSWGTSIANASERQCNGSERVYATTLAILCLEIYYRHYPVYLRR